MQAERRENRCGVEEHHDMRCRRIAQRLADEQELEGKQRADQQPGAPIAERHTERFLLPEHQQAHQHCRNAGAQRHLHDRRNIGCSSLQYHLLQTPDHADDHHHRARAAIECFPTIHDDPFVCLRYYGRDG